MLETLSGWLLETRYDWPVTLEERETTRRGLTSGPRTVTLRPLSRRDESAWRDLRIREAARLDPWEATIPAGSHDSADGFARYVRVHNIAARRSEAMPFALEADGTFAGQVSVYPITWGSSCHASLGYWIGSAWAGRGVMTLAVAMTLDHLFSPRVGIHRVEINIRPENQPSLAVVRKLGLRDEGLRRGLLHIDGRWADHRSFAVVAEDLGAGAGAGAGEVGEVQRQTFVGLLEGTRLPR